MTETEGISHSFTAESSSAFESSSQIPSKSSDPNGLDIVFLKSKWFIFYPCDSDVVLDFMDWWNGMAFAQDIKERGSTMNWISTACKSIIWNHVSAIAEYLTRNPRVQCMHCWQIFQHPSNANLGTHAIKSHLEESKCSFLLSSKSKFSANVVIMMSKPIVCLILT